MLCSRNLWLCIFSSIVSSLYNRNRYDHRVAYACLAMHLEHLANFHERAPFKLTIICPNPRFTTNTQATNSRLIARNRSLTVETMLPSYQNPNSWPLARNQCSFWLPTHDRLYFGLLTLSNQTQDQSLTINSPFCASTHGHLHSQAPLTHKLAHGHEHSTHNR